MDFFPEIGLLPTLSPSDVERFVALGKEGWNRLREGDAAGSQKAFEGQIAIFRGNPEPFVSLALLAARRGDDDAALRFLRAAIVRGFSDLPRIERAEVGARIRKSMDFLSFQEAVPRLLQIEESWGDWSSFRAGRPPGSIAIALREQGNVRVLVDRMSPALGPRLTRLWNRAIARSTAALLEAYVRANPDAADVQDAAGRLLDLYASTPLVQWRRVSFDAAERLDGIASFLLDRFPESPLRPGALVGRALARYAKRDAKSRLEPEGIAAIRAALGEVLDRYPDSAFTAIAAEGLVKTEAEAGRMDLARTALRRFEGAHVDDEPLRDAVRGKLGPLALLAGGVPDFRATALDGGVVDRSFLDGKVVVVDFWATWCRPCVEEIDTLRKIDERYGDRVAFIGVNLDRSDEMEAEALREWVASQGVPGRQIHDGLSWDSDLVQRFGVREIPFSLVVGPDGSVVAVNEHGRGLQKTVRSLIAKQ